MIPSNSNIIISTLSYFLLQIKKQSSASSSKLSIHSVDAHLVAHVEPFILVHSYFTFTEKNHKVMFSSFRFFFPITVIRKGKDRLCNCIAERYSVLEKWFFKGEVHHQDFLMIALSN